MIYLDSAATTFQKPPAVAEAMQRAMQTMGSPGRGGHSTAMRAAETAFDCRSELAELFHMRDPERVVFTMNATHALNIAIKSLVPPGGKVVISGYEHNAVTRPLAALKAKIAVADGKLFRPDAVLEAFSDLIESDTDAVICSHVSNVFGFIQPVEAIAALCKARRIPLVIDASQSAGVLQLDMEKLEAAFIAMPGHKGLYGPQGTGVLLCGKEMNGRSVLEGGTGSLSLQQEMPEFLPDKLEAGTHNMPGIAGLLEGVRYIRRHGAENILRHETDLMRLLVDGLRTLSQIQVFADPSLMRQAGVLSFREMGRDPEETAGRLAEKEIAVRAGLHCAPLAHQSAGTLKTGTVRVSLSHLSTEDDVYAFLKAMQEISKG